MSLERVTVAPAVSALRPDFAVLALAVTGLENGPLDAPSDGSADDLGVTCRRWNWRHTRTSGVQVERLRLGPALP